jgi:methyl-accepting chemotaxis protein
VVASEVRVLAQRSAAAAKEIKGLIDASSASIAMGASIVKEADGTISDVVHSVSEVVSMIAAISASSTEQRTGIGHINVAISEMDSVTQQNAALVEEAAASAASLQIWLRYCPNWSANFSSVRGISLIPQYRYGQ